jgi:hypothetical protein
MFAVEVTAQERDANFGLSQASNGLGMGNKVIFAPGRTLQIWKMVLHRFPPDRNRRNTNGRNVFLCDSKYTSIGGIGHLQARLLSDIFLVQMFHAYI